MGVEDLSRVVAALEARVAVLEMRAAGAETAVTGVADAGRVPNEASVLEPGEEPNKPARMPALGRAMLMLAGAFLLRALTDARTLEPAIGIALGMGYGLLAIYLTHREAAPADAVAPACLVWPRCSLPIRSSGKPPPSSSYFPRPARPSSLP